MANKPNQRTVEVSAEGFPEKPAKTITYYVNDAGKRICGATKIGGGQCQITILYPNGRCRKHGGPTLRGAASPRFKHGRYSKCIPENLKNAYKRAENDPELLSLRSEVGLLQALAENALESMTAEAPPWEDAAELIRQIGPLESNKPLDDDRIAVIEELRELIEEGAETVKAWEKGKKELKDCIERKTYTATAEHKRLHDQSLALPVEQATAFVSALIEAAKAVVKPVNEQLYRDLMMETAKLLPSRPNEKPTVVIEVTPESKPMELMDIVPGQIDAT